MLSSLFRKQHESAIAFRPPDPQQAVRVEQPAETVLPTYQVLLSQADQLAADQYLKNKPLATEHDKLAESAKKALIAALGPASSGKLPDGRTVSKHSTPVPAESKPRGAHLRTSITIQ